RRARRQSAATIGTIAEFFAFALAVALFDRYSAVAPLVLLWPIALGALSLRRVYLLYLAAMGAAIVVEIEVLRPGSGRADVAAGQRARFRVAGEAVATLRGLGGAGGAFVAGAALPAAAGAPDALRDGHPFLLPLRDARRLVGFAVFASARRRRMTTVHRSEL